ncbi:MAG: hypothetical protein ACOY32_05945 [Thermodesulfobacteriota bacterium]
MGHRSHHHHQDHRRHGPSAAAAADEKKSPALALVVKGDTDGCEEAICAVLLNVAISGVAIAIIHKGIGDICKNDVLLAEGGSRLIIGFNVGVHPRVEELCRELGVEIRLYSVIYHLQQDIAAIAASLLPREPEEKILGSARVIALFKSSRKGIILGCQVTEGRLQIKDRFRVIAAMGPIYQGVIESLHIERDAVTRATPGQQVGLKIRDFKAGKLGDLVESYQLITPTAAPPWQPSGKILHL